MPPLRDMSASKRFFTSGPPRIELLDEAIVRRSSWQERDRTGGHDLRR
jgi:hypothetical protein